MATQSAPPPDPPAEKPQPAVLQPVNEERQDAKAATTISPPSVFVNSEPMREEQVQNAVKFLSHPKVQGSPVIYRRSFLEKKGLTKEEIDEAFRRVPDPSPTTTSVQTASSSQDGQLKPSNIQQPAQAQMLHPSAAAPAGVISKPGTQYRFHWSHAVLAISFLAVSGAGTALLFKNAVIPRLKSWIRKIVSEEEDDFIQKSNSRPSLAEEAAAAAKAAAAAAADVAKTSQELLNSKTEEERRHEEFVNLLKLQVQEMKAMSYAIRNLEEPHNSSGRLIAQEDTRGLMTTSRQVNMNGKAEFDLHSVRSSSPPVYTEPSVTHQPKSYAEIMAMVQRGEKPPNIRDINDSPPNPNQPISNPRLAPRTKPWDVGHAEYSSGNTYHSQVTHEGYNSSAQHNGVAYELNSESTPWWQKKNPRITEIETEDKPGTAANAASNERPVQRTWVPPPRPTFSMPEAAAAFQPVKPSIQRESLVNDQLASLPSDETDELQRITKASESGGEVEIKDVSSGVNSSEIQQEQE